MAITAKRLSDLLLSGLRSKTTVGSQSSGHTVTNTPNIGNIGMGMQTSAWPGKMPIYNDTYPGGIVLEKGFKPVMHPIPNVGASLLYQTQNQAQMMQISQAQMMGNAYTGNLQYNTQQAQYPQYSPHTAIPGAVGQPGLTTSGTGSLHPQSLLGLQQAYSNLQQTTALPVGAGTTPAKDDADDSTSNPSGKTP